MTKYQAFNKVKCNIANFAYFTHNINGDYYECSIYSRVQRLRMAVKSEVIDMDNLMIANWETCNEPRKVGV